MTRTLAALALCCLAVAGRAGAVTYLEPLGVPRVAGPGFQAPVVKDDAYGTAIAASSPLRGARIHAARNSTPSAAAMHPATLASMAAAAQ